MLSASASKNTDTGTWYLDLVYDRLYFSDETFRIFGISKDKFMPYYNTLHNIIIHPGDRATWNSYWDCLIEGTIPLNIKHRIVLSTGEIRHVCQLVERIVDLHSRVWLKGTVRDITWETTLYFLKNPVA